VEEAVGLAAEVPCLSRTLIPMPDGWSSPLLDFSTADIPEATDTRVGDLSLKRNVGLLLAHLVGWRGVLFLDDDIRDLSPRTVLRAAGALRPGWATGMIAEDFPDNSVVCHALRLSGAPQGVFVSGSALAVDTTTVAPSFRRSTTRTGCSHTTGCGVAGSRRAASYGRLRTVPSRAPAGRCGRSSATCWPRG
jgi:hypothetical protein